MSSSMSYLLSRRQLTRQFRGRAVHSRLFDRNPFIRAHQRQGVEVGPGREWHVNGQTEAQGTLCGEWFDIHGIILVATQIHQVAVPVAHDNDNDMSAPKARSATTAREASRSFANRKPDPRLMPPPDGNAR